MTSIAALPLVEATMIHWMPAAWSKDNAAGLILQHRRVRIGCIVCTTDGWLKAPLTAAPAAIRMIDIRQMQSERTELEIPVFIQN
jgi:hypothetical protein